ncbi:unnamed protein product, partial [Ceratitis capitata]
MKEEDSLRQSCNWTADRSSVSEAPTSTAKTSVAPASTAAVSVKLPRRQQKRRSNNRIYPGNALVVAASDQQHV